MLGNTTRPLEYLAMAVLHDLEPCDHEHVIEPEGDPELPENYLGTQERASYERTPPEPKPETTAKAMDS